MSDRPPRTDPPFLDPIADPAGMVALLTWVGWFTNAADRFQFIDEYIRFIDAYAQFLNARCDYLEARVNDHEARIAALEAAP